VSRIVSILDEVRRAAGVVRLRPFDQSTPEGRSKERYRRAALMAASQVLSKVISVVSLLVSVPLALGYLHEERYGLWMTISSAGMFLAFADLGIGNGVMAGLAIAHGRNDREMARSYVSSGAFVLALVGVVVLVGFGCAYPFVPWARVLKVESAAAAAEAGPAVLAFVCAVAVAIPLGLGQRIHMGYQDGLRSGLWQCGGSLLSLAALLAALAAHASLPWLVLAVQGVPTVVAAVWLAWIFAIEKPWLRPSLRFATAATARTLFASSAMFFIVQMAAAVGYQCDTLVINWIYGPEAVAEFAVVARLFWLVPMLTFMLLSPLWPAYGEALARGDVGWVRATFRRSLRLSSLVCMPAAVVLTVFGREIVGVWTRRPEVVPSWGLLVAFGIWAVSCVLTSAVSMLLNGAHAMRFLVVTHVAMAAFNVGGSIVLAKLFGLPGVLWGTILSQVLFILIPTAWYMPRLFARQEREGQAAAAGGAAATGGPAADAVSSAPA
jgi:O-antigen/teichoic acid export membrane protein